MFTVSCFCIFLNFIEIYSFIQYSIRRRYKRRVSGRGKSVRIADFEPSHIVRRYSVDHALDDHAEEEEKKENVSNQPVIAFKLVLCDFREKSTFYLPGLFDLNVGKVPFLTETWTLSDFYLEVFLL